MTSNTPVISAKNVWKLFGPDPEGYLAGMKPGMSFDEIREDGYIAGVKDVSIEVARGEMLVIMGLSGSGKSTVLRALMGLTPITGGEVEIAGEKMNYSSARAVREARDRMAIVFQQYNLFQNMTVMQNLTLAPLKIKKWDKAEVLSETRRLLGKYYQPDKVRQVGNIGGCGRVSRHPLR